MLCVRKHYFEQNELLMFTLEGEITSVDLGDDVRDALNTPVLPKEADCLREVVDCRRLEISETVPPEDLVAFAKKILTWRDCEMLLLIPADSPLHEGMAEALSTVLANKRKRIWLHYTADDAINLLNLIQQDTPERAIHYLKEAV